MQAAQTKSLVETLDQLGVDLRGDDLDADDPELASTRQSLLTVGRLTPIRLAISCCDADCS